MPSRGGEREGAESAAHALYTRPASHTTTRRQPPHLADAERLVEVAVPAVQVRGHVDVDDVAVLQLARVGDAVADDLFDCWCY